MVRPSSNFAELSHGSLGAEDIVASGTSISPFGADIALSSSQAQPIFADALKAALEQIEAKREARLPDGKPFFFPDGIKSLEIAVTVGTETGVTLKINEGQ